MIRKTNEILKKENRLLEERRLETRGRTMETKHLYLIFKFLLKFSVIIFFNVGANIVYMYCQFSIKIRYY